MRTKDPSVKVVLSAIFGNLSVTIVKTVGWFFSPSPSLLAESIHSLADTANQTLIYLGIRASRSGPSRDYPWGKGQARYVWNLVSAVGIFFVGFGVTTYHGVQSLLSPPERETNYAISISIILFSFIAEGIPWVIAYKAVKAKQGKVALMKYFRTGDDPTAAGVFLEDSIAILGLFFALIGMGLSSITQSHLPDAVTSIIIGLLLGAMACILVYANSRILLGASAHADEEDSIIDFINRYPSVERVTSLRTEILSPNKIHLCAEIEFHGGIVIDRYKLEKDAEDIRSGEDPLPILFDTAERSVRLIGREINELESAIRREFPQVVAIDLEVN